MSVTVKAPHDLRATLATMKSAKEKGCAMSIWDRDINAVEEAIATRCELQFSKGVAGNISEAADEIARLQKALRKIEEHTNDPVARSIAGEAIVISEQNAANQQRQE